jgi:hypothetical protein
MSWQENWKTFLNHCMKTSWDAKLPKMENYGFEQGLELRSKDVKMRQYKVKQLK